MNIAIRVDSSSQIGTGHLIRCLTLAEALRNKGAKVVFVCRKLPGHLCKFISYRHFDFFPLPLKENLNQDENKTIFNQPINDHWLYVSQQTDVQQTIDALPNEYKWDWIIVDHYALDAEWESSIRSLTDKIMVIDDLANREHDCDILLDQNYFRDPTQRYKRLLPEHCLTLFGPKYALLRHEIRQAKQFAHMKWGNVARAMVYFGGSDPDNITGVALKALDCPELSHLLVDVVVGPNNPHLKQLKEQASNRPGTRLHIQPEGFTELMLRADICIGAGGTTTWERLCLNLPSLVVTMAANQEEVTKELYSAKLVKWIGKKENTTSYDIKKNLVHEIQKSKSSKHCSTIPNPVDSLGVLRVVETLIPSYSEELNLRSATIDDMELYYFWVNDPVVRENSFHQEPILWKNHVSWFTKKLEANDTEMWVMQNSQNLPVGQIRFDINDGLADISYSLDFIARKRDWGKKLLELGMNKITKLYKNIIIIAKTKKKNKASRKIFKRLGFTEIFEDNVIIFKK
jgi:UDP-2,4-diacetamido-2,4,6-trideoxy-beta-L-altropyranose hydrolase